MKIHIIAHWLVGVLIVLALGFFIYLYSNNHTTQTRPGENQKTFVSQRHGFSLVIPLGYHADETDTGAVIAPDMASADGGAPLPVMVVNVMFTAAGIGLPPHSKTYQKNDKLYVLSPWEDMEWQSFNEVAASFKFLAE